MKEITIRHCETADIEAVRSIYAEPEAYTNTLQLPYPALESWQRKLQLGVKDSYCLVAVMADEVVGQLGLHTMPQPRRRHVATLGMGVKAAARRRGVGSALMAAALDLCDNWLNISRLEIEVYCDNKAGLALYTKYGFEIEGTCQRYAFREGVFVDAHLMARLKPV